MSEELAKALHDLFHGVWHVDQPTNMAGSVLALPEMAALLADAERVRRVEALPAVGTLRNEPVVSLRALRRALDGDQ